MKATHKITNNLSLLKFSVLVVFIGRAWQFLFWDAPLRTFFWDEHLLKPIVEGIFKVDWNFYATSEAGDQFIQYFQVGLGVFYLIAILMILFYKNRPGMKGVVLAAGVGLVFLALLEFKGHFYYFAQFWEYSIQFSIPFLLVFYNKEFIQKNLILILKIISAIVFISHGLFAIGYYPVPGHFVAMTINIFGLSNEAAYAFLQVAGILDFVVAVLLFVPRLSVYALCYMVVWGLLTALARVVAGFQIDFLWESLHANLYQTLIRLPHGLIPLLALKLVLIKK